MNAAGTMELRPATPLTDVYPILMSKYLRVESPMYTAVLITVFLTRCPSRLLPLWVKETADRHVNLIETQVVRMRLCLISVY